MLEKEFDVSKLIAKYLQEGLSDLEQERLDSWLHASSINRDLFNALVTEDKLFEDLDHFRATNSNSVWLKTINKIHKTHNTEEAVSKNISLFQKYKYLAVASIIVLAIGVGLYLPSSPPKKMASLSSNKLISPGKNSATLTLSNGKKIVLSDALNGEISNQSGVSVSKTADGQLVYTLKDIKSTGVAKYNTLSTTRGEQYQVILPDGTKVWLNASSSIIYPESFASAKERKVKLIGEAYFEVAKNKNLPFYVESKNQLVEVLGTHFNINSYEDEVAVKTTLLEGSVKINGTTLLKPNEQAIVTQNKITINPVIAESYIDWKSGVFAFKTENLPSIMRKISRWYDVEIVYELKGSTNQTYTGTISRSDDISNVLHVLKEIGGLQFKVEGKKIIVRD